MLWFIGFIIFFIIGGFTGFILLRVLVDVMFYDIYFVIGYFYYVLLMGVVFIILVGFIY